MRRGSLVGPLLLIGIGALFLARNVMPDLALLDFLARYWPALLILWGGLRLLELAIWAAQGKPLPRYGVNGGEWTLVIFLCLFGFSLHAARGLSSWLPRAGIEWGGLEIFGESYDYPVAAETPASANARIVLENFRGSARIIGGDTKVVKVTGKQSIRSMDRDTAERASKDVQLELTGGPDQITIQPHQDRLPVSRAFGKDRGPFNRRVTADLEITVPKGATVVARGHDGDFDIASINGSLDVNGENSSVRLENIGGDIRLEVTGSDLIRAVNVRGGLELKGRGNDIDLEKVAGPVGISGTWGGLIQLRGLQKPVRWNGPQTDITMQGLPGEWRMTIGDVTATGVVGPLQLRSTYPKDVTLTDVSGSADLNLQRGDLRVIATTVPVANLHVRLDAGNVDLALPESARFAISGVTESGDANSEYGDGVREQQTGRRGATITGGPGGGATIDIHVNRGTLQLRRSEGEHSAPPPVNPPPKAVQQ